MAVAGDVSVAQDGGQGNVKLHPYLVTLVRWCVSCLWSTATVVLHRLMVTPLQPIAAAKPSKTTKSRAAGTDHLHPEPKVECMVLHTPEDHTFDVIFVHGLYGSLGNTWRQGDWRPKYKSDPKKVPLRDHSKPDPCECRTEKAYKETNYNVNKCNRNVLCPFETNLNETAVSFQNIKDNLLKKILPNENTLITEQFYNNTLLDQVEIIDNYDTQAKFVQDLFKSENNCDVGNDKNNDVRNNDVGNECICNLNETICDVGCGCVCDQCYSPCWPKDWIKADYPGARVISINYTSDPYLWRPLWIKEIKRLRLHERAEQMMEQLLQLGVGRRPIVWVGHSKGGLFIKQIYCEAYEAYQKMSNDNMKQKFESKQCDIICNDKVKDNDNNISYNDKNTVTYNISDIINDNAFVNGIYNMKKASDVCNDIAFNDIVNNDGAMSLQDDENMNVIDNDIFNDEMRGDEVSSRFEDLKLRASLWTNSAGFMFYSVPHRGSPLADIKTPITARSIELLEISKDCSLVLDLQSRWLEATSSPQPPVRGLVETCRTLMSVLWLRIVSVDSADAGIGTLSGVAVDHREICKPSSRECLLYKELTALIQAALHRCKCF